MEALIPQSISTTYCESVRVSFYARLDHRYHAFAPLFEPLLTSASLAVEQMMVEGAVADDVSDRMKTAGWLAINKVPIDVIDELEVALIVEAASEWPHDVVRAVESAKRVALEFYEGFWPFEHPAAVAQAIRFGTLANHLPAPVFMADVDERITFSSAELDALLGCVQGEVERQTMHELFDTPLHSGRNNTTSVEMTIDGDIKYLDVTLLTTETFAGMEYFGFVTDRTRERHLERMRDGVVGAISHELRTPLTAVIGYLDLLSSGALPRDEHDEAMSIAKSEADLLLRLVSDIVDFSKLTAGTAILQLEEFELLREVETSLRRALPEGSGHRVDVDIPPGFKVMADADRIGQLLTNLFTNIKRYGGPSVTVSVEDSEFDWAICVHDDGDGIPPSELDQILDPFVQGSRRHTGDGAGLGLAICAGIASSHGGTLTVENDNGAKFTAIFPKRVR